MSEYETPFIIHRSETFPSEVTGGINVDSDAFPILRKPIPITGRVQDSSLTYDPTLCVTPERPTRKPVSRQALAGESLTKDDPKLNSKVRFDKTVQVKQLSPETSAEDVTKATGQQPVVNSYGIFGMSTVTGRSDLDIEDEIPIQTLSINEEDENRYDTSDFDMDYESKTYQYDVQDTDSPVTYPKTEVKFESIAADPLSIMAKDTSLFELPTDKASMKGYTQSSDDSESAEELCQIMGESDHVLARPEFNSTLKFSKELHYLQSAQIDIHAAVQQKLQSSDKTREKVSEMVCGFN